MLYNCVPNFVEIGAREVCFCMHLLLGEKKKKDTKKSKKFLGSYLRNCWGYVLLSNFVC